MKAACFSVAAMDFFPQQKQYFAGGNSLNQAIRFRQLGLESAFVGALGCDDAGGQILDLLKAQAVDVSHCYRLDGQTASNQIVNDEHGERFGVEGAWDGGVYADFRLSEADWDFVRAYEIWATHANGINYDEALARKTATHFLAVDFLHFNTYELLDKSLNIVDIAYFGGTPDMADDLARFSLRHAGLIVLTLGAGGSIAFQHGKAWRQAALPLNPVVDCTGCGDAFQAGFTSHYYLNRDIEAALLAGATLGREAASQHGGASSA